MYNISTNSEETIEQQKFRDKKPSISKLEYRPKAISKYEG